MRMETKENNTITEDEAALYDRQIRLWGLESQQRIRNANILVVGMKGLGNEICKNLVLAGIGSLTILDHEPVTVQDLGAQFFLTESDIGKNRAEASAIQVQALNPRVLVKTEDEDIEKKTDDFFEQFDVVCVTNASKSTLVRLDGICRLQKTPFYAADTFGMFGYIFCDLHSHNYIQIRKEEPTTKSGTPREISEARVEEYCTFSESLDRDWSDVKKAQLKKRVSRAYPMTLCMILAQTSDTELSPVCAIVGGILAQEIIKVLSGKELPIQNWFFYDGIAGSGLIHHIEKGKSIILQ
ncbi:unnamed protein product [Umbelopsis vinacea]